MLHEIFSNFIYWQDIVRRESVKLGENLEDIINFAEVQRISINRNPGDIWFFTGDICKIDSKIQIQYIVYPHI